MERHEVGTVGQSSGASHLLRPTEMRHVHEAAESLERLMGEELVVYCINKVKQEMLY
jgi:hypothetical protein